MCAFLLCVGMVLTSCEETNPIDDNKTEQGGNENNGNEGGDENNGNGNEGGENTGGEENGDKGPATLTLSKVTATTATFSGHLDVPASDLSFSKVTVYYSDAETFNVNNASYRSTTSFDGDQNFSINISELKSNTQYNYCVVTEVKSEKTYGEIKNFTTTEIGVSLTPKQSNIISGSPIAEFDIIISGLTEEDNNIVGILFSSSEENLHSRSNELYIYPSIISDGTYTIKTDVLETDSRYYYCYYISDDYGRAYIYGETNEINTTHPYSVQNDLDFSSATNLSSSASANSYIVSEAGLYKIKTVKGNSNTPVGNTVSGSILWECVGSVAPEFNELISSVCYKDGYLAFKVAEPFKEGNALIAVKDPDNQILWSWHIWLTDTPQSHTYDSNGKIVMMDRNLGATSVFPGEPCYGMLYQWGRKDPFPGMSASSEFGSSYGQSATTAFSEPSKEESRKNTGTTDFTIANPTTLLIRDGSWFWDREMMPILWQASKTIYDPCPIGWKVPSDTNCWSEMITNIDMDSKGANGEINGIYFKISSPANTFYPYTTHYDTWGDVKCFVPYDSTNGCLYWSADFTNGSASCLKMSISTDRRYSICNITKKGDSSCFPVRCIKE